MVRAFAQRFASAAVDRRSRRVDAAGWFDWLTTPLLSKRRRAPFWLLAAVTATGTLAMHILIPVLTLAAADFSVSRRAIQQAITLYLFGIAGGQLLYGPVSDRFGRRPTLIAALILWMGISSPFFTRRTEAYTQNVLQLMQRPQAYNAGGARIRGTHSMDMDHAPATPPGLDTAAFRSVADAVKLK